MDDLEIQKQYRKKSGAVNTKTDWFKC